MKASVRFIGMSMVVVIVLLSGCSRNYLGTANPLNAVEDSFEYLANSSAEVVAYAAEPFIADVAHDGIQASADTSVGAKISEENQSSFNYGFFDVATDHDEFSYLAESVTEENKDDILAGFYATVSGRILGLKTGIRGVVMRFHGSLDDIDPDDFTDMVFTRDGVSVENRLTYYSGTNQFNWGGLYFEFEFENNEPGVYSLTGKYKGVDFIVHSKILESDISETPANPDDFEGVGIGFQPSENGTPLYVSEISFHFNGVQQSFYLSDLTSVVLMLDGETIPFAVRSHMFRYLESGYKDSVSTSYALTLEEQLATPGAYQISGYYMGETFSFSWEIQ